jgi:hypothetical protein
VPEHDHFLTKVLLKGIKHVSIAVGTRKNDYSKFHI